MTEKYVKYIKMLGWKTFVAPPCFLVPEVVRKLYTNMDPRARVSTVQGIEVSYAFDVINKLYKLPHVPMDQNMSDGAHDWEEVRHTLCMAYAYETKSSSGTIYSRCLSPKKYMAFLSSWSHCRNKNT